MMSKKIANLFLGAIFIAVGIIVLLVKLEFIPESIENYLYRWELLIVLLGVYVVSKGARKILGLILILVGSFLYIDSLFSFRSLLDWMWPISLILIGVFIIVDKITNNSLNK